MAFYVHSKRRWVGTYFNIVFWLTVVLAITWFFLPEEMNNALLPIVLLIAWRSWSLSKNKSYAAKGNYN
jgi:uncharacterized membrane-anchored protein